MKIQLFSTFFNEYSKNGQTWSSFKWAHIHAALWLILSGSALMRHCIPLSTHQKRTFSLNGWSVWMRHLCVAKEDSILIKFRNRFCVICCFLVLLLASALIDCAAFVGWSLCTCLSSFEASRPVPLGLLGRSTATLLACCYVLWSFSL